MLATNQHHNALADADAFAQMNWAVQVRCVCGLSGHFVLFEALQVQMEIYMSDKQEQSIWPVIVVIIAIGYAFRYGGMWIGIGAVIVGVVCLGWSKRHEGPLPTDKD